MSEAGPPQRALSLRVVGVIAAIVLVYTLGLYVAVGTVAGRLTSSGPVLCGRPTPRFATPGRMLWPHGLAAQDATERLLRIEQHRFPYSTAHRPPFQRDRFEIRALGLGADDPGWTRVPRVDGHPLWIKSALVFGDLLLVWGEYQVSPGAKSRDVQVVLDAAGRERQLRGRQRLVPRAIDALTRVLISLEERETILGAQPREEERPPQALVLEPLDETGLPQSEASHRHPIRKLQNLLADGEGHVYVVRWLAGSTRIAQSQYGHRLLEKLSIRERRVLWSIRIDDEPVLEHHPRPSRLVQGVSGIRFEEEHPIPIDETGREARRMWRARIYDRTSGASLGVEPFPPPNLDPDRRKEIEVAGRRYALRARGLRGRCVEVVPVAGP